MASPLGLTIKNSLADMQIGDCIPCRYTALTSGSAGTFSELGTCTANEIPVASSATPDGLFYFVHAGYDYKGRMKLIADRNIQHTITWDTLNNAGLVSELSILDNSIGYTQNLIPTMTSNTTPSPYIASASNEVDANSQAWKAFDKNTTDSYGWKTVASPTFPQWISFKFDVPKTISMYTIKGIVSYTGNLPKDFIFQGSIDGITWIDLDYRSGLSWTSGEKKEFYFKNNTSYLYYRVYILSIVTSTADLWIDAIEMMEKLSLNQSKFKATTRLLTGGVSATDKDNEWDKIIAENILGGKITAGDNNIWHWSGIASWTSSTGTTGANRIIRGNATVSTTNAPTGLVTTTANATTGYRPVLLVERVFKSYQFVRDANGIYSLKSSFYKVSDSALKDFEIEDNGASDLSLLTKIMATNVVPTIAKNGMLGSGTSYESCEVDLTNAKDIQLIDTDVPKIKCNMNDGHKPINNLENQFDIMLYKF